MPSVLSGVRVLDLTGYVAGPYCSKILAEYGAEVVKVEPPGQGDAARSIGPFPRGEPHPERSALFLHLNTNKLSITLDITHEAGAAVLRTLAGRSDVIVDDGALANAAGEGWDYDSLARDHPGLVLTTISPFGDGGPYRDYRAPDIVLGAMGGWMYPMGDPDRAPLQPGGPYHQYVVGLWAAAGTLSAFLGALGTGTGEHVRISALEAVVATTVEDTVWHAYTGDERGRHGRRWGADMATASIQSAEDGYVLIMGGPQRDQLFNLLDDRRAAEGLRARGDEAWGPGADELEAVVQEFVHDRTRDELFHAAQALRLPFAPVASPADVLRSPQLLDRGYFIQAQHPEAGSLLFTGSPYQLSETPGDIVRAAPTLGQDNEDVYRRLAGLDADELKSLQRQGII